jgi:glycosyltransferase involved in cell wall biosynthesis
MLDNRANDHPRSRIVERIKSFYLRLFDGFLASGSDTRDYLERLAVPRSRIRLGYDCVDNDRIADLVKFYRSTGPEENQGTGYLLCIGRLIPVKNIPGVLRAYQSYLQSLPDSVPPATLVICGDGPERSAIEDLIGQFGIGGSTRMVGEVIGIEAVARYLAFCKALILASTNETWGLVVNEAMAARCPVLVSMQCGCARDLVENGGNGFIFDAQDSDELARHMVWLHTNGGQLEAMGKRSQEIVDLYAPARFATSASSLAESVSASRTQTFPN